MNRRSTIFILILCMLGLSMDMFSQGGSDCSSATTALPGTNIATQGIHQFFKYTPIQDEVITLSGCSSPVDYKVTITKGCSGKVDTFMTNCNSGNRKQISFIGNAGSTYILDWLSTSGASPLTYSWDLAHSVVTTGQNCATAITATATTNNHYVSTGILPIWYAYTATQDARIEISTEGFNYPAKIKVFGSCNPDDSLESFQANISATANRDLLFFYAKANQTYYFRWNNPNNGNSISYDFKLEEGTLTAGETCDNPISLDNGSNVTGGRYPRWYSYTNLSANIAKINISNCNGIYAQARKSCGLSDFERSVRHTACGIQFEAQINTTSYVKLYPTEEATITATITLPSVGEACDNPKTAVVGSNTADHSVNTDQWFTYTPAQSGIVTLTSADPNFSNVQIRFSKGCGLEPYLIGHNSTEVAANTTLYICLRGSAFTAFTYNFNLALTPVTEGSSFNSAIPVTPGTITPPNSNANTWYKYSPAANSNVSVSACGSYFAIYDENHIFLGSVSGTTCPDPSTYSLLVEGGKTIYINFSAPITTWDLTSTPTGVGIPAGYSCSNPIALATTGAKSTAYIAGQRYLWYTYQAPADGILSISNCANNPTFSSQAYILSDCQVIQSSTLALGTSCGANGSGATVSLNSGQTVYIAWWQRDDAAGTFNWTLNFTNNSALPQGYTCNNPNDAVLGHNTSNTLLGDEILTYVPAASGHLQISTVGLYSGQVKAAVYETCGDYLDYNAESGLNNPLVAKELSSDSIGFDCVAGKTYYIVWTKGYTSGDFTWNLAFSGLSSNAEISAYTVTGQEGASTINSGAGTISLQMPYGASLTALVANYTAPTGSIVRVNSFAQTSGVTANDFTTPKTYAVTAQNGTTTKNWTVTVTNAQNHAAEITAFSILGHNGTITSVNATTGTIGVSVPFGTDVTALVSTFTASAAADVKVGATTQVSGTTANDFTSPVAYVVTAQDGTTIKTWTVTVTVLKNTEADVKTFSILGHSATITSVNATTGTIGVTLPFGTDVTSLASTFTLSTNASAKVGAVAQVSTVTLNNFTNPVDYTVTADDGTTIKTWTVTVTVSQNNEAEIAAFTVPGQEGSSTITTGATGTVAIKVPFGASLTGLVPTFTLSAGASAKVGAVAQVSGTTSNDFTAAVTYVITAQDGITTKDWTVTITNAANHAAEISAFAVANQEGVTTLDAVAGTIALKVPFGTDLTALVPTFTASENATVKVGAVNQVSGTTANDFTAAVTYVVTAQDGTTIKDWTVTITAALNHAADLLTFTIPTQEAPATISSVDKTVSITLPYNTDVTALVPSFTASAQSSVKIGAVSQVSGTTANDFTTPLVYAVTAQDGTTVNNWTVTVTLAQNHNTDVTAFSIPSQVGASVIDKVKGTIDVTMPYGADVTALVSTFTLSEGASAKVGTTNQVSGTTANDFTSAVKYLVTAQDGTTTQEWSVIVTVAKNPATSILTFSVPNQVHTTTIDETAKTVSLMVQAGSTSLSALVATFTLSPGATAKIGDVSQVSGTTSNDFTSDVTYVVTAEDGITTTSWTVTIKFNTAVELSTGIKVKVFPNPASELVYLNVPASMEGKWKVQILGVTGQLVYADVLDLNEGKNPLNVSNLNNGVYSVVLTKGNDKVVTQLVINK